ncbi:F-box protein [Legionella qingyii]|uniref:F-box protein n=1 Tax=Legionella qingyii TaxID=2184757 RepID=A0A317U2A9_9GAMM|nr:F-box-like domain-containing protein [Legionella qingyii]PWY56193.1 F-box protein [Legionella qingyii]RUR22220.1 F-box protein [Legionella qingyii]RUR25788.1 F-box protein [Legionella qingyii]
MNDLPREIIVHILNFLDVNSLLQISYVSHFYHTLSDDCLKWIKLCLTDPICQPLLQSAMLKEELLNLKIDAKSLYQSIQVNDVNKIRELLFTKDIREFVLYAPFYERNVPQFFPRAGDNKRNLYLTEDAAKKNTPNAAKVKHWLKVGIAVEKDKFEALYSNHKLQSQQAALPMPIIAK